MSLYPSLEDMKVDQMTQAQVRLMGEAGGGGHLAPAPATAPCAPPPPPYPLHPPHAAQATLYPGLEDYMGLEFTPEVIAANMPEYIHPPVPQQTAMVPGGSTVAVAVGSGSLVAPLSGASPGLQRSAITHAIREVRLCKDGEGKVGVRVHSINKGVFVCLVSAGSPAALAGLRFGDQILSVCGVGVAGLSMEKVHRMFKDAPNNDIPVAIRDRPFERCITLHRDSSGHVGFQFRDGQITAIVKDSSAARNGLLTDHHLLEVNGQNVVGVSDKEVSRVLGEAGQVVTVTIMPTFVFTHMLKQMAPPLLKLMDRSLPDL